jgi:hypothetical protein
MTHEINTFLTKWDSIGDRNYLPQSPIQSRLKRQIDVACHHVLYDEISNTISNDEANPAVFAM